MLPSAPIKPSSFMDKVKRVIRKILEELVYELILVKVRA
jgi:hypothetical protein